MNSIPQHKDANLLREPVDHHTFDAPLHKQALEELSRHHVLDYSREHFPPRHAQGELWSISPKLPSLSICVDLLERCMCYTTSTGAWTCEPLTDRITAGISAEEAQLWWHFFTDPAHLEDHFDPVATLTELYHERTWRRRQDVTRVMARFKAYVGACRAHATFDWCPRDMMWLASLMGYLIPPHQVVEVWLETEDAPGNHERVIQWLERPDTPERAAALDQALVQIYERPVYRSDQVAFRRALMWAATDPALVKRFARFDRSFGPRASLIQLAPNDLEHFLLERDDPELWAFFYPRGLRQITPRAVIKFVELAGYEHLPQLFLRLVKIGRPGAQRRIISTLCAIHSVHAVRGMLDLYRQGHVGKRAKRWLLSEGVNAIVGLCQLATSRTYRALCARFLRVYFLSPEHSELVKAHIQRSPDPARRWLEREVIERTSYEDDDPSAASLEWFGAVAADAALKYKRPPTFASVDMLPRLRCAESGQRLPLRVSRKLLCLLSRAPSATELLDLYREHVCNTSLSRFVRAVFQEWLRHGAEVSGMWVSSAQIELGGALGRLELLATARAWSRGPKRGRVAKIVALFEAHKTLDSDYLISTIQAFAPALELGGSVAKIVGDEVLSSGKIAIPEILPTLGFDGGGYTFALGERTIEYVCGANGELELRDRESRRVYSTFPRRRKSDDPELYEWSQRDYSIISWHANLVRQDMITELARLPDTLHAWPRRSWAQSFCDNPLFRDLGQRLLWMVRGSEDTTPRIARLCEDLTLSCAGDEHIEMESIEHVALAHPAFIPSGELASWCELFSEYEIIQPFEQLARDVIRVEPLEMRQLHLIFDQHLDKLDVFGPIAYWRLSDIFGGARPVVGDGITKLRHYFDELRVGVTLALTPDQENPSHEGVPRQIEFWRYVGEGEVFETPLYLREVNPLILHDLLARLALASSQQFGAYGHYGDHLDADDIPF